MQDFKGKVSIIMPAHNEAHHIASNLRETVRTFRKFGCDYEIIVVDDGSRDHTFEEAQEAASLYENITVVKNHENFGKGFALKTGFQYVNDGDIVIFLDADLELHPGQINDLFDLMQETGADVMIGSKHHPRSVLNYPRGRKIISRLYAFMLWALFRLPLRDTQTGLKLFKYKVLENIFPKIMCKRYAFDVELLANAHHLGYKIKEAPIVLTFREPVRWKRIGWRDFYLTGNDTLAIFYRMHILRYYDRPLHPLKEFPPVSVLIPVRGDNAHLRECLNHCRELNYPHYEVIVLPDSPMELSDKNVKVVPTGPATPSEKRDKGIKEAKGEILAFLDDDAFPLRDWLRSGVRNFADEEVGAVGGPAETPDNDSPMQMAGGEVFSSFLVAGNNVYRYTPRMYRQVDDYPTCNLFVRKSVMEAIGGFATPFWPGEDTIICLRITKQLKKKIIYDPDVYVKHHRRPLFLPHLRQVSSYALHRGYFVKRFPATSLKFSYFLPSLLTFAILTGWLPGLFHPLWQAFYLYALIAYLGLAFLRSIKCLKLKFILPVFLGIVSTHFVYGIWFIKGLLSRRLPEE